MIDADQLEAHLKRAKRLDPFYLVAGSDELLKLESVDLIRRFAREAGFDDREVLEMSGNADWSQLSEAAASIGMFSPQKLLEVRLPGGRPGTRGADAIQRFVERPMEGVVTVFSMPAPDWQGKKSAWWTALSKASTYVACDTPERSQLPRWLARRFAKQNQELDAEALEYLADLVEGNLLAASQEVAKLGLLFPEGRLDRSAIESAVANCSRFETDTLLEAIDLGDAERACRVVDALEAQNEALPFLLAFLTAHLRQLIKLRTGMDKGMSSVPGVFATPAMRRAAKRLSVRKLSNALIVCADIDRLAKGLPVPTRDDNPWIELKSVAIFLAR